MMFLRKLFQTNVLLLVLIIGVAILIFRGFGEGVELPFVQNSMMSESSGLTASSKISRSRTDVMLSSPVSAVPPTTATNRMVVQDTTLSMVAKNVATAISTIQQQISDLGGYMVETQLSEPEGAASGSIVVRVPVQKREAALTAIRAAGLKTTSENVNGQDVTDEYVDNAARLEVLNQTKVKFQKILESAVSVSDLLQVQQELINLQSQIDSVKGQQKYLEQTAALTRITVYISTDEYALPYAPDQPCRPEVVFKNAVRSLITTGRNVIDTVIWIAVYLPIWGSIGLIVWFLRRRFSKN